jgi:ABC-type sugar transport system substrate-binding protein
MTLTASTKSAVQALPAEATTVRKVVKALKDAGTPVVAVWDGEELVPVKNRDEVLEAVFAVDQAWLRTESGAEVFIVLGNEWDALTDYSVSLEDALAPVNEYLQGKW